MDRGGEEEREGGRRGRGGVGKGGGDGEGGKGRRDGKWWEGRRGGGVVGGESMRGDRRGERRVG